MPSTSRAVLIAGALLASASLAQAGDRAAFNSTGQDAMVDLKPIAKAPEVGPTTALAEAPAPILSKPKASRRPSHLATRAAKAAAVAALKATFPPAKPVLAAAGPPVATDKSVPGAPAVVADKTPKGPVEAPAPVPAAAAAPGAAREAPSPTVAELLAKHASENGVPLKLAKAVVTIESRGNVRASHAGALGLMQIKYGTARAAGFGGPAVGLFVADTNLRFGMKILGEAYRAAGGDTCGALMRYQSGHYATHMSRANRIYCSKARALMAGV